MLNVQILQLTIIQQIHNFKQFYNCLSNYNYMSDFQSLCQMTQSYKFMDGGSKTSIVTESPEKKNNKFTKCFKCGGKNQIVSNCKECKGKGLISDQHPMCILLSQIIAAKLPNLYPNFSTFSQAQICPIIQQSSIIQEKLNICNNCQNQCNQKQFSYCPQCQYFYLCNNCQKNSHEHVLIKIVQNSSKESRNCQYCHQILQGICEKCKECDQKGQLFLVCQNCKPNQSQHIHKSFWPHLVKDDNGKLGIKSEIEDQVLKGGQEYDFQSYVINEQKFLNSQNQKRGRKTVNIEPKSNIQLNQSKINIDFSGIMMSSEIDFPIRIRHAQSQIMDDQQQQNEQSDLHEPQKDKFVFYGYQCDMCHVNPIGNIRYHCVQCPNYDLCAKCFSKRGNQHSHSFKLICAQQTITKRKEIFKNRADKFLNKNKAKR